MTQTNWMPLIFEDHTLKNAIAALIFAFSCAGAVAQSTNGASPIVVSDTSVIVAANGFPAIIGVATNKGEKLVHNAFVKFNLYDAGGNIIGNTIAHGQNIGPNERWRFEAPFTSANAHSYKVTEVTSY